jgi:aarF domain-containing kinase
MSTSIGPDWNRHFASFDRIPFAAASIGQVHNAVLSAETSPTGSPAHVAVKVQFPNIENSIDSDLGYIKLLLTAGRLLPKGLFLDRTVQVCLWFVPLGCLLRILTLLQVMKEELADECDYTREASFLRMFGSPSLLGKDSRFKVPWVWEGSTNRVLVMERLDGISVGEANVNSLSQRDRNDVGFQHSHSHITGYLFSLIDCSSHP